MNSAAGGGVGAQVPAQRRGRRGRTVRPGAAQGHAGVLRLDHHADPARIQPVLEPGRDLGGQPFLGLRSPGVVVDDPGELRQADDPLTGQVGQVGRAEEREQVVLAHRLDRDVADQHQLVVLLHVRERREVELRRAEELGVRLGQAPRASGRGPAGPGRRGRRPSDLMKARRCRSAASRSRTPPACRTADRWESEATAAAPPITGPGRRRAGRGPARRPSARSHAGRRRSSRRGSPG